LRSDGSGQIDYAEFCEILVVDPSPGIEKLFQMFDSDRSGQIDVKEFLIGLSNFTGAGKDEKIKFAFSVFDENGDGVITKVRGAGWGAHEEKCRPSTVFHRS
jgi:serine/threonine-protein phosphatase 2B regulatory subunit